MTNKAGSQKDPNYHLELSFLESLNSVSDAINKSDDVEITIDNVIEVVFEIFQCDRIWLFYPCDPDAPTFKVLKEKNVPKYPGAFITGQELPITPEASETIRKAIDSDLPVVFGPEPENSLDDVAKRFSVRSQIIMAIHPKTGKPWMFGMHQCDYDRVWTKEEQLLFKEISIRVVESLNNLILLNDLKKSERKYRHLLENIPQKIFHKDINSKYVSCNRNYANDLKIKPEQIVGTSDYDYYPKALADKYIKDDRRIMESRQTEDIIEKHNIDNNDYWVHTIKTPLKDENEKIIGVLGIFRDISELKKIEAEKAKLESHLHQAAKLEAIGTLAGGIAHDFNNILSVITGNVSYALSLIENHSELKEVLSDVTEGARQAQNLTQQLLTFSRGG